MDSILVLVALAICIMAGGVVMYARSKAKAAPDAHIDYEASEPFLAPSERRALMALKDALGRHYFIYPKVRVADFVAPALTTPPSTRPIGIARVAALGVDFLVCESEGLAPAGVVFLGQSDPTDAALLDALAGADIDFVTLDPEALPDRVALKELLQEEFDLAPAGGRRRRSPETPKVAEGNNAEQAATSDDKAHSSKHGTRKCPSCDGTLYRRRVKKGPNAGRMFWNCSNYPTCKTSIPITMRPRNNKKPAA